MDAPGIGLSFNLLDGSDCSETCMWRVSNVGRVTCNVEGQIATSTWLRQSDRGLEYLQSARKPFDQTGRATVFCPCSHHSPGCLLRHYSEMGHMSKC